MKIKRKKITTKFGTLYIENGVGGFMYHLCDSRKIIIQDYDNDMPIRWAKDLKKCKTEKEFFDTLAQLMNVCLIYETNKKRLIKEVKAYQIKEYEEAERTYDILISTCRVGKYNVYIDYCSEY